MTEINGISSADTMARVKEGRNESPIIFPSFWKTASQAGVQLSARNNIMLDKVLENQQKIIENQTKIINELNKPKINLNA